MKSFLELAGWALVILAICFGIGGCCYLMSKADAISRNKTLTTPVK